MAARLKRALKTWMFIYVALAVALLSASANGMDDAPSMLHVPAIEVTGSVVERRFFETRLSQTARIDI